MNRHTKPSLISDRCSFVSWVQANAHAAIDCIWPVRSGYNVLRILVAAVLLIAAALKCHQLATEPIIEKSWLDARWLLMVTVEFELFFGFWLLANILPKPTWFVAISCFGTFTCISLYKAFSGYATCGCFGRVPVNPWYTSTLDVAIVLSLLIWRPKGQRPLLVFNMKELSLWRVGALLFAWLFIGLPAGYAMNAYSDVSLTDAGDIDENSKIVLFEPQEWVGKRFPLFDHIDIGDRLQTGRWRLFLYHHDCPNCQAVLSHYVHLACNAIAQNDVTQVALIEMPPYEDCPYAVSLERQYTYGRLSDTKEWFVRTPREVFLDNGVLTSVGE